MGQRGIFLALRLPTPLKRARYLDLGDVIYCLGNFIREGVRWDRERAKQGCELR